MKVALVHDWLNTKFGGAEKILAELADMYPEAPIFTLLYNQQDNPAISADRVHSSNLERWPAWLQKRSRYLLPLIPRAIEQFDLSGYDVVISSSTAFAKGVITGPETLHICYCHTPMRFVWDYWPAYVAEQRVGPLRRVAIHRLTSRLRLWDYYSAARVDRWVANSETTAARIRKYYHQEPSTVIYPGADLSQFTPTETHGDYLATLCVLTPYKKIDLAIAACNESGRQLVVIGDGADRARLEKLAGPTIRFAGRVSDAERQRLLAEAQALIYPNEEDFGIVPIEAMASGTPVIAFQKGGLTETIVPDVTGLFFKEQTPAALAAVLENFDRNSFSSTDLTKRAATFSTEVFRKRFRTFVEKAYHEHRA